MDALVSTPPEIWLAVHLAGIVLALSSRSHLGARCAFCTNLLLGVSTLIVGCVATVGFLSQQPFWAASGCTLGLMAVMTCFERGVHETDVVLRGIASAEQPLP